MQRRDYFIKRLLLIIPTFLCITFIVFGITRILPGGPVEQAIGRMRAANAAGQGTAVVNLTPEELERIKRSYGFDKPFYEAYWIWLVNDRVGMQTMSLREPDKTTIESITARFRVSLIFGIVSLVLTYLVCIPLGIAKALRDGKPFDMASSLIIFSGYAIPSFAFGLLLKLLFCGTVGWGFDWFPVSGFESDGFQDLSLWGKFKDRVYYMFLPILCYVVGNFAVITLLMKNSLLEQINQDYIRTVLAKGVTMRRAIWVHALRNALIPIATGIGGILTVMFAGSVLIENVFEIPGMGRLSLEAITQRDYPVFMSILAITSILGLLGNVLQDLVYVFIDPRINYDSR
jgi:microcin C transport system permease protein